jgi:hypothetical protein
MTAQAGPFAGSMIGAWAVFMMRCVATKKPRLIAVGAFRAFMVIMSVMLFIGFIKVVKLYVM